MDFMKFGGGQGGPGGMAPHPAAMIAKAAAGAIKGVLNPKGTEYGKIAYGRSDENLKTQGAISALTPPVAQPDIPATAPATPAPTLSDLPLAQSKEREDLWYKSLPPIPGVPNPGPPGAAPSQESSGYTPFWKRFSPETADTGTIVTKPTMVMLGERQPEAVVPLSYRAQAKVRPSMALPPQRPPQRQLYGGSNGIRSI